MKGLIIIPAYFPDKKKGGSISGCRSFAKAVSLKHNVEICTLDTTNDGDRIAKVDDIKVTYFKITKGLEWLSKSGWGFSFAFSIWFLRNNKKFDYIYIRSLWNYISLFSALICIFKGKKYIISSSGKFSKYALKSSYLKKLILSPLVFILLKKALFIHYPSEKERLNSPKYITKLTKSLILNTAIEILPNSFFNQKNRTFNNRILIYTVSRFDRIKRIEILSSIVKHLKSNVDIVHIGDYKENLPYYKEIIDNYTGIKSYYSLDNISKESNAKRIFFPGFKNINEVNNLIKNFNQSIFIQMSYSEGQSNSILEAMARGSICLVSKGCNMNIANKENSIVIANELNILKNINSLLNDSDRFNRIKNNQKKYLINNHSYKKISQEFDGIISRC